MRPYLRVANVFEDRIDLSDVLTMNFTPREFETFALRANDILLNEGQSLHLVGRPALYRDELPGACFQNTLVRFRCGPEVEPKFALTIFRGYMHTGKFQKIARWTTNIAHLGAQRFAEMPFPLPPLPEQRRIVAEIEKQFTRLEAGVAALRRVQANLKRYRAAVLKAACEGRLVPTEAELALSKRSAKNGAPDYETGEALLARILTKRRQNWQGPGRYKEPSAPDTAGLPLPPDGWTWARAEQLCGFITKGTTPSAEKMQSGQGEIPFIKVYNLTFTGALNSEYKPVFISRKTHEEDLARSEVRPGDILINIVGPPLGQVSIVPATITEANINQAIARFRAVLPECRKLLGIWLMAEPIIAWAMKRAKTTAGQSNLTLEHCRDLPIPLPPLAEQTRIVAEVARRLSVAEELEAVVSANLQRAIRLRQSILQKAFTGKMKP